MGSIFGGSSQTTGYKYFMAIHMGLGRGQLDSIIQVTVGEKMAWPVPDGQPVKDGPNPAPGAPVIEGDSVTIINAPDLFGGDKGEGGIVGPFRVMMGSPDQVVVPAIKQALGGDVPDFRGVTTLYFDGTVCSLNPYPKAWKFRVRRHLKGWDGPVWHPELAKIVYQNGAIVAMNPAHILYEAATNRDWGRGFPRARLDDAKWLAAAQTLYDENFGLCIRYNRQDDLSQFVELVINHINAVIYTSKDTGLLCIDLIRDDYDVAKIPFYNYENGLIRVDDPEITSNEDRVNEVIVKYKDPIMNEERSSRAHNLASIQTLGGVKNSSTVEYPGIPNAEMAARIAARDLKVAATSGQRYTVFLTRAAWRMIPGSVFRISAPDRGIENLVLRAGKVEDPNIKDGTIKVLAIPDVFGLPVAGYVNTQPSMWQPPDRTARSPVYSFFRETTYRDMVKSLSRADVDQIGPNESYVIASAAKPTSFSQRFNLYTKTSVQSVFTNRDEDAFAPTLISSGTVNLSQTTIPFNQTFDASQITLPCAAQFGFEIIKINSINYDASGNAGTVNVVRGCIDTVPTAHDAGEALIFYDNFIGIDPTEYARGEILNGRITVSTSSSALAVEDATELAVLIEGRQGRPYSASRVRVNGSSIYGTINFNTADILIEWQHRNRIQIQDLLLGFYENGTDKEPGTYYKITISDANTIYRVVDNIDAVSYTYTEAQADADGAPKNQFLNLKLETFRDDQTARILFNIPVKRI